MRFTAPLLVVASALAAAGCENPVSPAMETRSLPSNRAAASEGAQNRAAGGGHYTITTLGIELQFSFSAVQLPDGRAQGAFHHRGIADGALIDFKADVTCLAVDAAAGRAWIGGVITRNESTHPGFTTTVHQPGHDIWFRVQDNGPGLADTTPDVTTIVGFEGIFPSSQVYCETRPWNAANVWPISGNVTVFP